MLTEKWCGGHKITHPVVAFGNNKRTPSGLAYACKEYLSQYNKDRYGSRPDTTTGPNCPVCRGPKSKYAQCCMSCTGDGRRRRPHKGVLSGQGYRIVSRPGHPNSSRYGKIAEHVWVMSEVLGRPLLPGENVHHKNGVRADNRPENLELWVVSQPAGQRPEDLVAWAQEILQRYGGQPS